MVLLTVGCYLAPPCVLRQPTNAFCIEGWRCAYSDTANAKNKWLFTLAEMQWGLLCILGVSTALIDMFKPTYTIYIIQHLQQNATGDWCAIVHLQNHVRL